jgi:hypothetical protein
LVALNGITGDADEQTSAHSEVNSALTRDKIKILVLVRDELQTFTTTEDLVELLLEKDLQLTLYKTLA